MKPRIALLTIAATILTMLPKPVCASGTCGECYNTGVPGKIAWYQGSQYCVSCN